MDFKKVLKYNLILLLCTSFLEKLYFLVFNIQDIRDMGIAQVYFDPFIYQIIFTVILILMIRSITQKNKYSFNELLISVLAFIIIDYCLVYFNYLIFYYLNNTIHSVPEIESGLFSDLYNAFPKPDFLIIESLVWFPFYDLLSALKAFDFKSFVLALFYFNIILATIVIYYYSLVKLFEQFNRKGFYAIIPIKNDLVLLELANKPTWWIFPLLVPFVRLVPKYLINVELAKKFNKENLFALGMTILPWFFYGKLSMNKR
ncbi:hypothetical protein KRX57_01835 [Weeksellaceae bacterium TAE3-ERU29]|nr:hypothetical protein [Weeksellaceae bacterium TAE3-ERU29]